MNSDTNKIDTMNTLRIERDIADAVIAQLDRQAVDDVQHIALLRAKLRARDKLIARLSERISGLEGLLYENDDLRFPPPELADAFADFTFDEE